MPVYIIHATMQDGSIEHYIGWTKYRDLSHRLHGHKKDWRHTRGSRLIHDCASYTIHMIDAAASRELETTLRQWGDNEAATMVCPVCSEAGHESSRPATGQQRT